MHKSCYTLYSVRRVSCNAAVRSHQPFHSNTISKPPVLFQQKHLFKIGKRSRSTTSVYARTRAHAHEHPRGSAHNRLSAVPLMVTLLSEKMEIFFKASSHSQITWTLSAIISHNSSLCRNYASTAYASAVHTMALIKPAQFTNALFPSFLR